MISSWGANCSILLRKFPAVALLKAKVYQQDRIMMKKISLEFRDLIEGTAKKTIVLYSAAQDASYRRVSKVALLDAVGDKMVAVYGKRLFFYSISKDIASLPQPLQFKHKQIPLVVDTNKKIKISYAVAEGKGKRSFKLLHKFPGLALDSKTGTLTVDVPLVWKEYLTKFQNKARSGRFTPHSLKWK